MSGCSAGGGIVERSRCETSCMAAQRPMTGQIVIEWVDATEDSAPPGEFNFGWRIRTDPPIDDERLESLLREILETV